MPGKFEQFNPNTKVLFREMWWRYQGDTLITPAMVDGYVAKIIGRLNPFGYTDMIGGTGPNGKNGPLAITVDVWNCNRDDFPNFNLPPGKEWRGMSYPYRLTLINHANGNPGTFSHEFGHQYGFQCDILNGQVNTSIGQALEWAYKSMRDPHVTSACPIEELWASDFAFLFGTDDAYRVKNPAIAVQADQVLGLEFFMRGAWPVAQWLHNKAFTHFTFDAKHPAMMWLNLTLNRWECWVERKWWHDGSNWVPF